jgi:hypothetical protein
VLSADNLALIRSDRIFYGCSFFHLVNSNGLTFTEQCVAAIYRTVTGVDYEVLVVDNALHGCAVSAGAPDHAQIGGASQVGLFRAGGHG